MHRFNRILVVAGALLLPSVHVLAAGPVHYWSHAHGAGGSDMANAIAVDSQGNVYVAGEFYGTASFGGVPLVSAGENDIFLAKYNTHGAHLWSVRAGGTSYDRALALAVGLDGRVYVTGSFRGTVDFGGGPLVCAGNDDAFLACFYASGLHDWSRQIGTVSAEYGRALAVAPGGEISIAGSFGQPVDLGGGELPWAGSEDIFYARFHPDGEHGWSTSFGSTGYEEVRALAVDRWGRVYLAGYGDASIDFGGGPLPHAGDADVFIASIDEFGQHRWSGMFGDAAQQNALALAVDASGDVYVTGMFLGTLDLGGGPMTCAGLWDGFVAKFGANGAHRWSHRFGGAAGDYGAAIAVDPWGDCYLTGYHRGQTDFGGGPIATNGVHDVFIASLNAAGGHRWSRGFGGPDVDAAWAIAIDPEACVYIAGQIRQTMTFGGSPLTSAGGDDVFVAMFGPETGTGAGYAPAPAGLRVSADPNPFNPATTIRYTVPSRGRVTLAVYDVRGVQVAALFDGERDAGAYALPWNGRDRVGNTLASGVYFVRATHPSGAASYRVVLLK